MKMSDIERDEFLSEFYAFLLEKDMLFEVGDSYELLELFLKDYEFSGD